MAGFAPYILLQGSEIQKRGYDGAKVTAKGYLELLLSQGTPNIVSQSVSDGSGHVKDVKYYYRQRGVAGLSRSTDNCDIDAIPVRLEANIPSTLFKVRSLLFDDAMIAQYEADASKLINIKDGTVKTGNFSGIMNEIYQIMIEQANGLLADINGDLLDLQAAAFGTNVVTGSNAAQTLNFDLSTATNPLNSGLTKLLTDARRNEIDITSATIVGSGLIDGLFIQQMMGAISTAQNGVNQSRLGLPKYFYDPMASTRWGANQFGMFEKDSVQLLAVDRFVGPAFSGPKGTSQFFNIKLPITNSLGGTELSNVSFDCQFKYFDCPQTINVDGTPTAVGRGWNLIMSKSYYQVNKPSDSFNASDVLTGVNGTLRYTATNS